MTFRLRLAAGAVLLASLAQPALAQRSPSRPAPAQPPAAQAPAAAAGEDAPPAQSALDGELFYQLLLGELSVRSEDPGTGFGLILDAARKTNDPALYQRAVEIAFQSRAGDAALQAARAWKQAHPGSRDANRYVLQILLALNRPGEAVDPLRTEMQLADPRERLAVLSTLPRLFTRVTDKRVSAQVMEQGLSDWLGNPATGGAAWTAVGRMRLAAGDYAGAAEAARRGATIGPGSEFPALLALELMDARQPQAEAVVRRYLESPKPQPEIRMAYARALLDAQRYGEAQQQVQQLTTDKPDMAEAWLVQGTLQLQQSQLAPAETSLKRFVELAQAQRASAERNRSLAQAYLALAQVAEKRRDFAAASGWLDKIEDSQELVSAQTRRASILAGQGKLDEARKLIRGLPERNPGEARLKLNAEVQLLRDQKQWKAAYELLANAVGKDPKDADLLYDQAMMAEKLGNLGEMERLLRQVIALRPDYHHAFNALGYSLADRNVRLPEAKQLILKALEAAPGDPFISDSLGWVEFRLGNRTEALRILEEAYKSRPDAEIAAHLGEVLWSLGQRERATSIFREGLLLSPENETLQETVKRLRVKP